ncbi:AfsR/SARP family transcriptional regulator [Micromonosporaceae bacterium Da 78-11]
MRWINRAGTALIAVAIIVGPPLALGLWVQAQHWRVPTATQTRTWLEQPPTAGMIGALLSCIAVTVWLLLVFSLVRRAWGSVRARVRRLRYRSLPTSAQMAAGSMAGVAALALPTVVVDHHGGASTASADLGAAQLARAGSEANSVPAGVELPGGGWVPYRTALAVTVLSATIWLHRRQHYQPRTPRYGQHHADTDLQPLPATAEAITAALNTDGPQPQTSTPGPMPLPDLPSGVLTLHGPGAMNAARGLLVTTVLSAALTGTEHLTVTVRPRDLKLLLDERLTDDLPHGLHLDHGAAPLRINRRLSATATATARHPMLLLTRPSGPTPAARSSDTTSDDTGGTTLIVVTDNPAEEHSWFVNADGTTAAGPLGRAQRLCTLDAQAATDLLMLARQHARRAEPIKEPAAGSSATSDEATPRPAGELHLLGDCRLEINGSVVHVQRSAGLQILAYLAVHPDGATTTELIRAIWPGLDPNTITKRLHTTLTDLRRQLHQALDEVIIRHDERYRLNPHTIDTDLRRLRQAISAAGAAVTAEHQQTAAQAVIDAYGGELAAGFSWPWLHPRREALRRDVIDAYLHLASRASPTHAVELIRTATTVDPDNDAVRNEARRVLESIGQHDPADVLGRAHAHRPSASGLPPPSADHAADNGEAS